MPKLFRTIRDAKPTTVGLFLLTCLWSLFQWRYPTPPPVLDQILVATFGAWFASETLDRKNKGSAPRSISISKDGNVTVSELPDKTTEGES